jgi:hypothetical protein
MSALEGLSAEVHDERPMETRSSAPDVNRRGRESRIWSALSGRSAGAAGAPPPSNAAADRRSVLPKDLAQTASSSPESSPESSPRGPRLERERAAVGGAASRSVDYAAQMQNRWLEIASRMPQIVEDTYLMGGVPIYRSATDKNVGVVLQPTAAVGLGVGVKFH